MKRAITIGALCLGIVAIGAPASSADNHRGKSAIAKECAQLKKADKAAFRATFGPKRAMKHCKKGRPVEMSETTPREFKNAAKECRAEREADAEAFQETYGTETSKRRNAFGKCVSSKVKDDEEPAPDPVE